jgi:cytochrome c oxidase subunit 1
MPTTEASCRTAGSTQRSDDALPPALSGLEDAPEMLDNLALWTAIALTLVVLACVLPLGAIVADGGLFGPGISPTPVWIPEVLP